MCVTWKNSVPVSENRRKVLKTSNAFSKSYLCCATSTPQIKKKTNFFVIQVRLQLQEKLGCDLTERKKEVDSLVMEVSASHTVKDQFRPSGLLPSVADPDPRAVAFLTPGSGSGIEKNPNPGWTSRIVFKIFKFFDADPDPISFRPWIRDEENRIRDRE